ncbi:thioredoxin family protein [Pedobacter sp. HDW13]|uniref:thioredoxin family protein n=1 Tax=Pedobacter sp. HDW13 TaxID=2714940 RepID=UPI00140A1DF4|nr:thioredoxin fold domain-containing protein [Pedobacter sp. HDW13]QIL40549.1 thioredoxin family protein [Pedobacter sp. HDW13]
MNSRNWKALLLGFCIIVCGFESKSQGINFQHNLEEAIGQAKKEKKMIFVDFYTSWCAPCKVMSDEIFPKKEVGDFYNQMFVNVKIQCDDKGYGLALGKHYKVQAYPTLMFLDTAGNTVHSIAGGLDVQGFIQLGKTALDPNKNQLVLVKEWDSGNRTQAFMTKYFKTLVQSYRSDKAIYDFEKYFASLSGKQKASTNTFELMQIVKSVPFSAPFEYMEMNKVDYYKQLGKKKIDSTIAASYLWYFKNLQASGFSNKDLSDFKNKMKLFRSKKYPFYDEYAAFYQVFDSYDAQGKDDIKLYIARGNDFLTKYGLNNDAYTTSLTHVLGNLTSAKDEGAAGITWMESLLKRKQDPKYLNTYFYILWRNSRWDQALEVGQQIRDNQIKADRSTLDIDKQIKMVSEQKSKHVK